MTSCIICGSKDCISVGQDNFINYCWEHLNEWKAKRRDYYQKWRQEHPDYHAKYMRKRRKRERRQFSAAHDGDLSPYKISHISIESQINLMTQVTSCGECGGHLRLDTLHSEYYCSCCGLVYELLDVSHLYQIAL